MSDGLPEAQGPDLKTLHKLIRLMHRYGLSAIDLGEGPQKIRLRRGSLQPQSASNVVVVQEQPSVAAPALSPVAVSKAPEVEAVYIRSPMVGTFYTSSSPETPAFANVGTSIRKESTVCIIEAMKVFTEIPAGMAGTIAEVVVKNGQAVEYGQPLFRITQN
ncbi:MAG: acetyl-CoA carboxylase biotin carboxyl carrier protein [Planctomycetota bacterium]|nr:acetyl-CoA carboxylase biotin carboxyl carrier protein [Planctomycetota bacterium]